MFLYAYFDKGFYYPVLETWIVFIMIYMEEGDPVLVILFCFIQAFVGGGKL